MIRSSHLLLVAALAPPVCSRKRLIPFIVSVLMTACLAVAQACGASLSPQSGGGEEGNSVATIPDGIYVRIRPLSNRGQRSQPAKWDPSGYTAQDILDIIADLKPNVLERYTDGRLDPGLLVPVADGHPPMTVVEFLTASMRSGAPGCIIIPRLSLHEYSKGTLFETARNLYDFPIDPPMRILSLDNWGDINKQGLSQEEIRSIFEKLEAQGWSHIAVNMVGGVHDPQGFTSMTEFGVKRDEKFAPDLAKLEKIKQLDYVQKHLLYIDFPAQTKEYEQAFSPDERAAHLINVLGGQQMRYGYTFVWPVLQGAWDSTQVVTSQNGPYKGATLYEVMKQAMQNRQ